MADISQYLTLIDEAVKGEEVRSSIHDAIEAINLENEELSTSIRDSVQDIIDSAIGTSAAVDRKIAESGFSLTFTLFDGIFICNHSLEEIEDYVEEYPNVRKVEDIPARFIENSLAGFEEIIGQDEYWPVHYHIGLDQWYTVYFTIESGNKLYFNYKSFRIVSGSEVHIYDQYRYLINGGSGGVEGELTQYEYAKFNKLGGIILPFLVNTDYKQIIDFTNDHFMANNVILGSEYSELMHITQYSDKYYIRRNLNDNAQLSLALTGHHTFEHDPSSNTVKFDDNVATSIDFSSYTNAGEHYVLGARNGSSMRAEPAWKHSNIKVHEYTLIDTTNDDILCHLVPAKYAIGEIVLHSGLYDTVSKQFYSCDGMTVGGDVINS